MEDPVHVTLNRSPSAMSPCVNSSSGPNRLSACEAPPVLRTGFSKDLPEQLQCSEKGGEIDTRHKSTTRNAVGSKNRSPASGGVTAKDTIKRTTSNCLSTMTEGREESQQLDPTQIQDIHTGFFPPIRHIFPRTSDRTSWYPRSDFQFSVGPMVRTYTTNVTTL